MIDIQEDFPVKRITKKKNLSEEKCSDESRVLTPYTTFKSNVYSILDTIINSIQSRFLYNEVLLKYLNWLDPRTFSFIKEIEQFLKDSLKTICKLAGLDQQIIAIELKQFACQYISFLPTSENNFHDELIKNRHVDEDKDNEIEPTEQVKYNKCTKCIYCAFTVLRVLSYQSNLFCNLLTFYKIMLLLPLTQTTCERIFSKLKIVKSKLRSSLHQENLKPLMLMTIENDITIDSNT
jgi:hypothetical protein